MKLQEIFLDKIDLADETFLIRGRRLDDNLLASIRMTGVINPPWLRLKGDRETYRVVMGFRRISALQELGQEMVSARVSEEVEFSDLQLMESAIMENLTHAPFNPIEISRGLSRLKQFGLPEDEIADRFLPLFGLKGDTVTLGRYLSLVSLPDDITTAISKCHVGMDAIERVERHFEREDGIRIARLIHDLKLGVNRQRELVRLLDEIGRRDGISLDTILSGDSISSILEEKSRNAPQKAQALISALRIIRSPKTMELAEKVKERVRRLGLDPSIAMEISPYLEERLIRISFGFRSQDEYRRILDDLVESGKSGEIEELMNELFGGENITGDEKDG